jgi:hypothetical protein
VRPQSAAVSFRALGAYGCLASLAKSPAAAVRQMSRVFAEPIGGIPEPMDKLTGLKHAQQRIVKVQRRVWLTQALMWPTVIAAGVLTVGGLVWFLRYRSAGGRHEMPDLPGAHEAGTVHVEPDGRLSQA